MSFNFLTKISLFFSFFTLCFSGILFTRFEFLFANHKTMVLPLILLGLHLLLLNHLFSMSHLLTIISDISNISFVLFHYPCIFHSNSVHPPMNQHPMITRAKTGKYKPQVFLTNLSNTEPTSIQETMAHLETS